MKFADDINPSPAVTTEKDWNTLRKELDESVDRRKRNDMQFNSRNTKLCTQQKFLLILVKWGEEEASLDGQKEEKILHELTTQKQERVHSELISVWKRQRERCTMQPEL